ncbi:MAG: AraC family ligand binding domain-containing protein, partial [Bacteroidales bacterium]|nr:AraC family ligand binding domain-containing protein [Bacteroidales bacterium]
MSFIEFEKSIRHKDWSMQDLHSHVHYEIYFLAKGSRSFFLSNALYQVQAPVLIIIPPHVMHKTEGDPIERYNVNVAPAYLDPFQKETLETKALHIIQLAPTQAKEFVTILDEAISLDNRKRHAEYIRKDLFSNVVLMLSKLDERSLPPRAAT